MGLHFKCLTAIPAASCDQFSQEENWISEVDNQHQEFCIWKHHQTLWAVRFELKTGALSLQARAGHAGSKLVHRKKTSMKLHWWLTTVVCNMFGQKRFERIYFGLAPQISHRISQNQKRKRVKHAEALLYEPKVGAAHMPQCSDWGHLCVCVCVTLCEFLL